MNQGLHNKCNFVILQKRLPFRNITLLLLTGDSAQSFYGIVTNLLSGLSFSIIT